MSPGRDHLRELPEPVQPEPRRPHFGLTARLARLVPGGDAARGSGRTATGEAAAYQEAVRQAFLSADSIRPATIRRRPVKPKTPGMKADTTEPSARVATPEGEAAAAAPATPAYLPTAAPWAPPDNKLGLPKTPPADADADAGATASTTVTAGVARHGVDAPGVDTLGLGATANSPTLPSAHAGRPARRCRSQSPRHRRRDPRHSRLSACRRRARLSKWAHDLPIPQRSTT